MLNHPPSDEVIVVGVQRTKTPEPCIQVLIFESVDEGLVVKNLCAMGRGSTRHHKHTSIDIIRCSYLEVMSFQVRTAEKIPVALEEV